MKRLDGNDFVEWSEGKGGEVDNTTFTVDAGQDAVEFSVSRYLGENGYGHAEYGDASMRLPEEEVRELHLFLTVWLEQQDG